MRLRNRTLLYVGVTLLILLMVLSLASQKIIVDGYENLEQSEAKTDLRRAHKGIENDLEDLHSISADWAYWDDTYTFLTDEDSTYVNDNLVPETFKNLQVNILYIADAQQRPFYRVRFDSTLEFLPFPEALEAVILRHKDLLLVHPDSPHQVAGIMATGDSVPLLFVALPILNNDSQGPTTGTLIFGRYMDEAYIANLSDRLDMGIHLIALDDPALPENIRTALAEGEEQMIAPLNEKTIAGYSYIYDFNGEAVAVLNVELPSNISQQGEASLRFYLFALIAIGVFFLGLVLGLLEWVILSRLAHLSHQVNEVSRTQNFDATIDIEGKDELAELGRDIQVMLKELARSQQALAEANIELEGRVQARTEELSATNKQLQREIAERVLAQQQAAQARDQALDALRLKTQILANISHDARTPLTIIMLRAEMLQRALQDVVSEKDQKMLQNIVQSAHELTMFMDNLMQESRMSQNKIILQKSKFSPQTLLDETYTFMKHFADQKGLKFTTVLEPDVPAVLLGDVERLKQIIINLVSNAIKFTPSGSVQLHFFRHNENNWGLEVIDTGPGIPEEAIERIFEIFWQVDGGISRQQDRGSGLGLSIVKQLTTLMGGTVQFHQPALGTGSIFRVILPLEKEPIA